MGGNLRIRSEGQARVLGLALSQSSVQNRCGRCKTVRTQELVKIRDGCMNQRNQVSRPVIPRIGRCYDHNDHDARSLISPIHRVRRNSII